MYSLKKWAQIDNPFRPNNLSAGIGLVMGNVIYDIFMSKDMSKDIFNYYFF